VLKERIIHSFSYKNAKKNWILPESIHKLAYSITQNITTKGNKNALTNFYNMNCELNNLFYCNRKSINTKDNTLIKFSSQTNNATELLFKKDGQPILSVLTPFLLWINTCKKRFIYYRIAKTLLSSLLLHALEYINQHLSISSNEPEAKKRKSANPCNKKIVVIGTKPTGDNKQSRESSSKNPYKTNRIKKRKFENLGPDKITSCFNLKAIIDENNAQQNLEYILSEDQLTELDLHELLLQYLLRSLMNIQSNCNSNPNINPFQTDSQYFILWQQPDFRQVALNSIYSVLESESSLFDITRYISQNIQTLPNLNHLHTVIHTSDYNLFTPDLNQYIKEISANAKDTIQIALTISIPTALFRLACNIGFNNKITEKLDECIKLIIKRNSLNTKPPPSTQSDNPLNNSLTL